VRNPSLAWDRDIIGKIMMACVVLHNMIVEDERESHPSYQNMIPRAEEVEAFDNIDPNWTFQAGHHPSMETYMETRTRVRNRGTHHQLKDDLIEHIWNKFGPIE